MKTIGFIGIGVMGKSMVRNLMRNGFELYIYNRTKSKAEELISEGAIWCDSVADCAKDRDAIITIVGYPKDVEEVYFGDNGILDNAKEGAYLIDMTTTSPNLSKQIYDSAKTKGMFALDAPVSGGDIGAQKGTLSIMVGGDETAFNDCYKIFESMGTNIIYEGGPGSGQHVKMANQIAISGALSGVCEAVRYTEALGVDLNKMIKTIAGGAAGSWQLTNLAPKMAVNNFEPGFFMKHFIKDMKIAIEESAAKGADLYILKKVYEMCSDLEKHGIGENGTQSLIEYYRKKS